jgi:hypothetical protein
MSSWPCYINRITKVAKLYGKNKSSFSARLAEQNSLAGASKVSTFGTENPQKYC